MNAVWPRRARALAEALPVGRLHPAAVAAARAAGVPGGRRGRWAVALSGGPDSVALLLAVWAHWPESRRGLVALHFNHRLRGAASAGDARFCQSLCNGLGVPLILGSWMDAPKDPSEAQARAARHAFFDDACRRKGIKALWLGHQQDDIVETMFMRLARGSGAGGLAAPRPVAFAPLRTLLRPLLTLSKGEIEGALAACRVPFRVDESNRKARYLRNRLRRSVIPAWRRAADPKRDALAGAALSRELLQEDDEALEKWTDLCRALTPGGRLNLSRLKGAPKAVWRRALQRWLNAQRRPDKGGGAPAFRLSRAGFEQLLEAARRGTLRRFSLGASHFASIRRGWLMRETG